VLSGFWPKKRGATGFGLFLGGGSEWWLWWRRRWGGCGLEMRGRERGR
jgi:hypothetical protein